MMYALVRIILFAIVIGLIIIFRLKKPLIVKKRFFQLAIVLFVLTMPVIWVTPIENWFLNFDSPEAVFNYSSLGEILKVVHGNDSAMIVSTDSSLTDDSKRITLIRKAENGYRIPHVLAIPQTYSSIRTGTTTDYVIGAFIYHVQNTNDFYVSGDVWIPFGAICDEWNIYVVDRETHEIITEVTTLEIRDNSVRFFAFVENWSNYTVIKREQ